VTFMRRLLSDLTSLQIPDATDTTTVKDHEGEIEEKSKAADGHCWTKIDCNLS
jgi:hypothetical protein